MLKKILIANRGEIAVRIIRACRELGIKTVAVYSKVDEDALHTQLADEAICIGPAKASDSYLNMTAILSAAIATNAQAIHPGFGFLSENSTFATMCAECQIQFIGPKARTIDEMGNKANARHLMMEAGVPVIPGSDGFVHDLVEAQFVCTQLGYPVMLKAAAGGGGKGIRKVFSEDELATQFEAASSEAKAAFGDGGMYIEKVIYPARHVEVQILGDQQGHVIHLGERDCSLQRNNQKMMEETPCPVLSAEQRESLGEIAVKAAEHVHYESAGTIEFLLDENGQFYFMEMNTRIQVEHPITEMVTDIDIVKMQIYIASGLAMPITQKDVTFSGHSIECRINAENPLHNFAPAPGMIDYLLLPSGGLGLRVDSGVFGGYQIPPFYDSMIAKIVVKGRDRAEALAKMQRALGELVIEGIPTNQEFQQDLLNHPAVLDGKVSTSFLQDKFLPEWLAAQEND